MPNDNDLTTTASGAESEVNANGPTTDRVKEAASPTTKVRDPDRYQIIREHGRGGLGRVFRAHDRDLGRDVAVKELISRSNLGEIRFLREALITARLEHPGIVPVHEAGRWPDGTPFYAMKLVAGRPLRDLIAERKTVAERIGLLHHVIAVADALAYAHGRNIIHRDLKPANVIVGDFGETVVIDWGLAKELAESEETLHSDGPFRTVESSDLTATGSVLGTPAYMAPEQERGEHVDKRADVFAIGAMLWELCSLQKVPPGDPQQRRQMLRRAGIDADLVIIVEKALAPNPANRYRDAGTLASDLNTFKSGGRITARQYSLLSMLTHWTRRHRTLTRASAAAAVLAIAATVLYVRNVSAAQASAAAALARVEVSQRELHDKHALLTLKHAQLLLTSDSTAAMNELALYDGADVDAASQLRAEAHARGIAVLQAVPHTDNVLWLISTPSGVISLSLDGTIARTSPERGTQILARGLTTLPVYSYAPAQHLLAYSCERTALCLMDTNSGSLINKIDFPGESISGISFSPAGTRLAVISRASHLRIFNLVSNKELSITLDSKLPSGTAVLYAEEDLAVVGTPTGASVVHITGTVKPILLPESGLWAASNVHHRLVLAQAQGLATVYDTATAKRLKAATLCNAPITSWQFVPTTSNVVYSCKDGTVGIWDVELGRPKVLAHLQAHADFVTASETGEFLVIGCGDGSLSIIDTITRLTTTYRGHQFRITAVAGPTSISPYFLSGDVRGGLRVWSPPMRLMRVLASLQAPVWSSAIDERTNNITISALLPTLAIIDQNNSIRRLEDHAVAAVYLANDHDSGALAAYGFTDRIEIRTKLDASVRFVETRHGTVTHVEFVKPNGEFISSGQDGKLIHWSNLGESTLLAEIDQSIKEFVYIRKSNSIVFIAADGAVWHVSNGSSPTRVLDSKGFATRLALDPVANDVWIGYSDGSVSVADTASWKLSQATRGPGKIRDIQFAANGKFVGIATEMGTIHLARIEREETRPLTWTTTFAQARAIAISSDGLLVAACSDGFVRLFSVEHHAWQSLPTGPNSLTVVALKSDNSAAYLFDSEGRIITLDIKSALARFGTTISKGRL